MAKQKKRIYTVATAHLDTSWLWDLETTIDTYIPNTLKKNFALFEKYPDYTFNFEGSYRYELMEEYYPELFEQLKEYIAKGQWVPCGSCYENGDVNTPSPEALFRNILYGNGYFRKKFGKPSDDIFLPDCFGFGAALPSVAAHANLHGFATQKLTWTSAYGIPFDLGKWYGIDGSFVYASLSPFSYTTSFRSIRGNRRYLPKLEKNIREFSMPMTYAFHGVGDRGGAPSTKSMRTLAAEMQENDTQEIEVLSSGAYDIFRDMQAYDDTMPEWREELLLSTHGVGSYTSRSVGKRFNRRCEQLADAAERSSTTANWLCGYTIAQEKLEAAWKRVIAHQFHDDITGTSFQWCYKRNWNDYVQSMNQFAEEYRAANEAVGAMLNTSFAKGVPVIVSNPVQDAALRCETVTASIAWEQKSPHARVYNADGEEVPSQVTLLQNGKLTVAFEAAVPGIGYAVYDVRPADGPCALNSGLQTNGITLENRHLKIQLDDNGDICSIWDKAAEKEALHAPIRLAVLPNTHSKSWPAWEIKYEDSIRAPYLYADKPEYTLMESGAARVVLRIKRMAGKSTCTQLLILDANAKALRVFNEIDWRTTASLLKVTFPVCVANPNAAYDIGLGVKERGNIRDNLYEVPAQNWADISDAQANYGVSIFSDSRAGWDKPDDSTLRLTAVHTPVSSYRWECSQHLMDLGLNRFSFGVYPHSGDWTGETQHLAAQFNQPMHTFQATGHAGVLGTSYSFAAISDASVILRALKKAEDSDAVVVRFNEGTGHAAENVHFRIADGILDAKELYADEQVKGDAVVENGALVFSLTAFEPKTFLLKLRPATKMGALPAQMQLDLPYTHAAFTDNHSRSSTAMPLDISFPREIMPQAITSGGVHFRLGEGEKTAMQAGGQTISVAPGTTQLHLLACAFGEDTTLDIHVGSSTATLQVQSVHEAIGAWDLVGLGETGYIKKERLAFTATHAHDKQKDLAAQQLYLFQYTLNIPQGVDTVTLGKNESVFIFAATSSQQTAPLAEADELYDSLVKRPFDYHMLTKSELRRARPAWFEKLLDPYINRNQTKLFDNSLVSATFQRGDFYYAIRTAFTNRR